MPWVRILPGVPLFKKEVVMEDKVFTKLDYKEFEELVYKTYGVKYEIVASEELTNYTLYALYVDKDEDEIDKDLLSKFKSGEFVKYATQSIARDMCIKGVMKPGDYIIDIFW